MRRSILLALTVFGVAASPTAAQAATTLASGTLRNAEGEATSGTVTAFAWLKHRGTQEHPVVGRGTASGDGRYTVRATNEQQLKELSAPRSGSLDLILRGDDGAALGETVTTSYTAPAGARASAAGVTSGAPADIVTRYKRPEASTSQYCLGYRDIYQDQQTVPSVIGEINNAYKDTRANFAYGARADSDFTVAVKPEGKGFEVGGTNKVDNQSESQDDLTGKVGPYARQITSDFRLVRYLSISQCPGLPNLVRIRAEEWVGGIDDRRKLKGTLRVCPTGNRRQTLRYTPGGGFRRAKRAAVTWQGGAKAFGIGFDVSSGYSKWVRQSYRFGGRGSKLHFICGNQVNVGPRFAPRIFSGAAPGI